jgi:hypothetical protein
VLLGGAIMFVVAPAPSNQKYFSFVFVFLSTFAFAAGEPTKLNIGIYVKFLSISNKDACALLDFYYWYRFDLPKDTTGLSEYYKLEFVNGDIIFNEIQEEKPLSYYTKVQPFRTLTGASLPESQFLPSINFALTSPHDQPSGSVNASRIRLFQLDVDPWPLPLNPTYVYELIVYAENINFFTVESGYGGLKYAL